jgi:aminopeptidase N
VDISVYDVPNVYGQYKNYRNPVYLKGALFLEDLRSLIGDQAFFAALQDYVNRYAYKQADTSGFFAIVRLHTAQDIGPLLRKYFSKYR